MRLDAHQHFWKLDRGDYGWLTPDLAPIYRDFLPDDLVPLLEKHGIDGTILVQAAPTEDETRFLLELAARFNFIKGVVGWVDFEAPDAQERIAGLCADAGLVGLRPMIQDIPDTRWMLQPNLAPAFRAMAENRLCFDALTQPRHLPNLLRLAEAHPDLKMVVDHGSKPLIADREITSWAEDMSAIAKGTAAFCKLSGLVTEAGETWTPDTLKPYVDHLLDAFGPQRLIWGSDWPVCTLAASYDQWIETTEVLLKDLTHAERAAVFGGNAERFYTNRSL
ncbi:MAG: amidohydrolase family protein [Roseibium sp.]